VKRWSETAPSLQNIFKEIKTDLGFAPPEIGGISPNGQSRRAFAEHGG